MFLLKTVQRSIYSTTMKPGWLFLPGFIFLCLLLLPLPVTAAQPEVSDLLGQVDTAVLAQDRHWQNLLHYRPAWFGSHSLIDDPKFFFAENGKKDPGAELTATLKAFLQPVDGDVDQHPRCRFPARYRWLDQQLGFAENLEPITCTAFEKIKAEIQPQTAELIFPGSNFNNPASMFGHTLVSINGPYESKLLSHALNYSAFTQEKNGVAFAVKGIIGLYKGYYSTLPYYAKLKQYNDLERRDIWEYDLNFDADEMTRMFNHVWELNEVYSDYFFFDENCAYQLLFLFDIARPSLQLLDQARPWVIPVDTVRLLEGAGVIASAEYRPSKATRIGWIIEHMSNTEKELASQLLHGEITAKAVADSETGMAAMVRIFDLAIETLEFQYLKHELERPEYRQRYLALLKQRSYLVPESPAVPEIPVPVRPDKGHGSNRISLQYGKVAEEPFAELSLRPAYHNLLDADEGYLTGSQIDFANAVVRYYRDQEKVRLQSLDLVSIVSLAPRHRFYKPVSWKLEAGFERQLFADGFERQLFSLNPGGGFTIGSKRLMSFLLLETDLQLSDHFRDNYMAGVGGSAGMLAHLGSKLKLKLDARQVEYLAGDEDFSSLEGKAALNWQLGVNSSLVVEATRKKIHDIYSSEVKGGFNIYW
jgi:hypothetical protein